MKIKGEVVIFKSEETFFHREKMGLKPNTFRILTREEEILLTTNKPSIKKIGIEKIGAKIRATEIFIRDITDICPVGELGEHRMVVISWRHEEE